MAADAFPSRPIRLVVGFTPGTAADIAARTFATGAEGELGQKIVVENKPGAGSALAAEYVARAAKDGYTVFLATLSVVTAQAMKPDPNFDLAKDFAPIGELASQAVVLVVNPDSNLHSVADVIALAKQKPGEVLCANAGVGSLPHFSAALFAQRAGIKLVHVPYPGSPQAVNDLLAGRVALFFSPASTVVGQTAAGKLRALASASEKTRQHPAGRALDGGSRNARLRHQLVVRPARSGRHTAPGDRQDCERGRQSHACAGRDRDAQEARFRPARNRPRRLRALPPWRNQPVVRRREGRRRESLARRLQWRRQLWYQAGGGAPREPAKRLNNGHTLPPS